jgi:hypothetical protein
MAKVVKSETVGSYDFVAYAQEYGSYVYVEIKQHGKLIERSYMSNIETEWQPLIDRHIAYGF